MKIEIESRKIKNIFKKLQFIIPSFSFFTEITGLKIIAKNKKVIFLGKNEDSKIKIIEKNVNIFEEGEIFVKFKTINEIIAKIKQEKILLKKVENNLLKIESDLSKFQINLFKNSENLNDFIKFNDSINIKISKKIFKNGINSVLFSGEEKSPRKVLQGINFIIENKFIKFVSSDNIRISIYKEETLINENVNKILPIKNFKNIVKLFDNDNGDLNLNFLDNYCYIFDENLLIETKIIEGNFPKVEEIFNKKGKNILIINKFEIIDMIETSTSFSSNKISENLMIKLTITKNLLKIESNENEVGSSEIKTNEFKFNSDLKEFSINFNPKLLLDALKTENNINNIELIFNNQTDPFIVKYENLNNFKCLILPYKTI